MKSCPFCAEEIQDAAIVCKHCGRDLATGFVGSAQPTLVSPGVAAVLSLIIPGAGQVYAGYVGAGIVWLIAVVLGYLMFVVPGLILHLVCVVNAHAKAQPVAPVVTRTAGTTRVDGVCATCGTPLAADAYFCPVCRDAGRTIA